MKSIGMLLMLVLLVPMTILQAQDTSDTCLDRCSNNHVGCMKTCTAEGHCGESCRMNLTFCRSLCPSTDHQFEPPMENPFDKQIDEMERREREDEMRRQEMERQLREEMRRRLEDGPRASGTPSPGDQRCVGGKHCLNG